MKTFTKNHLDFLRKQYPVGSIVKLICMEDLQAPDKGTIGKVFHIDDTGTIHVKWENGSTLGVVYGIDKIEKVING
ncbi:MAG: DUF4314 domain-containing protein [Sphaerochaetaceae bacterium]